MSTLKTVADREMLKQKKVPDLMFSQLDSSVEDVAFLVGRLKRFKSLDGPRTQVSYRESLRLAEELEKWLDDLMFIIRNELR